MPPSRPSSSEQRELLYWLNSLRTPAALLVNDLSELCSGTRAASDTIVDVVIEVVNAATSAGANGGAKLDLSVVGSGAGAPDSAQGRIRAALRLLGQRVGWGNLAPSLFDESAAGRICRGERAIVVQLLDDLRRLALGQDTAPSQSNSHSSSRSSISKKVPTRTPPGSGPRSIHGAPPPAPRHLLKRGSPATTS